ncbi:MAG: asparagine synthase (glutamine-hydrolyzing) [Cyanobacteria bacterium]|nr:asparagine synthase (glutamine-hydrolyzing) [Cyanobacteriota bacterium]
MCGIAGYIGTQELGRGRIQACLQRMERRGPDAAGNHHWLTPTGQHVHLLHTRLSIIDLDPRSNQPFNVGSRWIAFNGELYNYLELKSDLKSRDRTFKTTSDTEVLLTAIDEFGWEVLDRCEGMWAFATYDERDGSLVLCRDLFGEKPLYLWQREEGLYFASEVKALAALAGIWPQINKNHLLRYLINGYKSLYKTQETFFLEVKELPRASCLFIKPDGSRNFECYWQPQSVEDSKMSYADAVAKTKELLIEAVRIRMRSDVPMAFCMSGGIDSNSLIAIAHRILGIDVHGFTIVNTDARYEEQEMVDCAVRDLGVRHTPICLSQENFLDNLRTLVASHDAPVYTISYYVHWQLMQAMAAHGYKVTVSGTGADELFTGYYDHHNLYLYELARIDPSLHQQSLKDWMMYQSETVRNPYLKDPDLYFKNPNCRDHIYLNNSLFSSWLKEEWFEPFTEIDYGFSFLRNRMANELFVEAVPVILHEDDSNAMFFSMENRSPFLDKNLFQHAYSIPLPYLIKKARAKAVLRDAMKHIVPSPILQSYRKVGFNAPVLDLINIDSQDAMSYILDDGLIYDFFSKQKIYNLLKCESLSNSESKFLFYFLNSKIFLETLT